MKFFSKTLWLSKSEAPKQQPPTKRKRLYSSINRRTEFRVELQMDKLGQAIDSARNVIRPLRDDLYSIYNQIRKDRHLKAQVETAINDVQQSQYVVLVDGKEDDELRSLFDREWMDDCIEYITDAEFWGHSLIEFPEVNEAGEFDACFLIPREYVDPVKCEIILDKTNNTRLPYTDKLEELNLIEVEGKEDLGLFEYAAEEVILKKFARTDWSQASERYGMPFIDYATDIEDQKELDKIADMCANFASNGFVIHGKDDVITIKEAMKSDFYKIYMEAITLANQEISKLINGQTATADTQAFVGTAQVHERILDTFTKSRLRRVQNHLNGKVLPLMVKNNYQNADRLAKAKIQYKDLLDKEPVINEPPADPTKSTQSRADLSKKKSPGKGKLLAKVSNKMLEDWLKRFFEGQEGIDPEMWKHNFESLQAAILDAGISFETDYQYANLAKQLRVNAASFAAFKNHDEQKALRALLVDADNKPRSWNDFLKEAKPITQEYNQNWLKTEYEQAVASAQMAEKWAGFEANADLYPNLEYRAVTDDRTRLEHAALNGVIRPINDPFWDTNYPPNGWGCRCSVTQTDKDVTKSIDFTPEKGFDFNPGKDKKLFADSNGYRADLAKTVVKDINKQSNALLKEYLNEQ